LSPAAETFRIVAVESETRQDHPHVFVVVSRARASARLERGDMAKLFRVDSQNKPTLETTVFTSYVDQGFDSPTPRELCVEVVGRARGDCAACHLCLPRASRDQRLVAREQLAALGERRRVVVVVRPGGRMTMNQRPVRGSS
jgi:hypothetical protein